MLRQLSLASCTSKAHQVQCVGCKGNLLMQKWNITFMIMFSLVSNHLKVRVVVLSLPQNETHIYRGTGSCFMFLFFLLPFQRPSYGRIRERGLQLVAQLCLITLITKASKCSFNNQFNRNYKMRKFAKFSSHYNIFCQKLLL